MEIKSHLTFRFRQIMHAELPFRTVDIVQGCSR
jgi:hypothetical protein